MRIGNLRDTANPYLSVFVLIACIVITGLLFVVQRAEALKSNLYPTAIVLE